MAQITQRSWVLGCAEDDSAIGMLELRLADYKAEVGYVLARPPGPGLDDRSLGELVAPVP